jgi:hypothetical protein
LQFPRHSRSPPRLQRVYTHTTRGHGGEALRIPTTVSPVPPDVLPPLADANTMATERATSNGTGLVTRRHERQRRADEGVRAPTERQGHAGETPALPGDVNGNGVVARTGVLRCRMGPLR